MLLGGAGQRGTLLPALHACIPQAIQPLLNQLVDDVARDEEYLESTLGAAAQYDEFTARLLLVLRETRAARARLAAKQVALGIHRSDYMLDAPSGRFLQVAAAARDHATSHRIS